VISNSSWILIAIVGVCVGVYYLYRQGKISWLKRIKMPGLRMFDPKPDDMIERMRMQIEKEKLQVEELRKVLEIKKERDSIIAEKLRLQREIEGVSPRSVEKEKWVSEQDKQDAGKVKPKRL